MSAATRLIGFEVISAQDSAVLFDDKGFAWCFQPELNGLFAGGVTRIGVSVTSGYNLLENRPDLIKVCRGGFADIQGVFF